MLMSIRPGYKVGDATVTSLRALKYCPIGDLYNKSNLWEGWKPFETRRRQSILSTRITCIYVPLKIQQDGIKMWKDLSM